MKPVLLASSLLAAAVAVAASPLQSTANTTSAACSSVSSVILNGPNTATPTVPARLAHDCLVSVPINKTAAIDLIDTIKPYINWQSTIAFLKNPPAEYTEKIQDAVDIWNGLDELESKVKSGSITGEYEFGWQLYTLIQSAHDGHFVFIPDSVGAIFNWVRPVALVSVSEDGQKLPQPFVYQDILTASKNNATFTPSAVTAINGQDAVTWLEDFSQHGNLQDRDGLYNNVFYELAQVQLGASGSGTGMFSGGGRGRYVYPGPETVLTFANGTERTYENYARALVSFRGVTDGASLADHYFLYSDSGSTAAKDDETTGTVPKLAVADTDAAEATRPTAAPGYPSPVAFESHNFISGYYLEGDDYSDVAVLAVPNFVSSSGSAETAFQDTGSQFLAQAKADGKTKLIIDVSANGGGTILQGYDLFKQLFPSILPYGGSRYRAHESLELLGEEFSMLSAGFPRTLSEAESNYTYADIVSSSFNYRTDADADYKPFTSWAEKFGPHTYNGDNFTSTIRWNLSDPLIPLNSGGITITGYGSRSNYTTQPFEASNIVIVYDGYCASTCTIFSELMRQQAGVKTIAMGGRANYDNIQAVGGVKGSNNFAYAYIKSAMQAAYQHANDDEQAKYESAYEQAYGSYTPINRAATTPGVNVRDGLRENDTSGVPLQFMYEEADCRIFYTAEMTLDMTAAWKAAADSQWGGNSHCVAGTLGGKVMGKRSGEGLLTRRARAEKKAKRDVSAHEKSLLEVYTDLNLAQLTGDGFMLP
ncbi:hypothetical protein K490DRAFT_48525 [Saccharata proteae CBS 121410]|uniref:CPAF-like PDZ domain-containing protein n=1 Tax=Saccharata proteae CBS 121410 TaxID=1314787 RepID=A0A9P4HSV7_9PEZI|nr:hypothetical protein K490DRAFT_48525 [Saccharata proteae CBS 121410]